MTARPPSGTPEGRPLHVGLVQMAMGEDPAPNLAKAIAGVRDAAKRGAQLVVLPELFRSRYFCQSEDAAHFGLAEAIPGPSTDVLGKLAAELKITLVASLFEKRAAGLYHNTAAVLDAERGYLGKYRKMHIPDDPRYYEKYYFTPGDLGFKVFHTKPAELGVLVCWDQWYPEAARLTAMQGAELLVYPTAIGWHPEEKSAVRRAPARRLGNDAARPRRRERLLRDRREPHGLRARSDAARAASSSGGRASSPARTAASSCAPRSMREIVIVEEIDLAEIDAVPCRLAVLSRPAHRRLRRHHAPVRQRLASHRLRAEPNQAGAKHQFVTMPRGQLTPPLAACLFASPIRGLMALVKKSKIAGSGSRSVAPSGPPAAPTKAHAGRSPAQPQTVLERIAAATTELASGLVEAAAAAQELESAMQQISAGAEEAAGASQQQSAAIKLIVGGLATARVEADKTGRRAEAVTVTLADATAQISSSVHAIERSSARQIASVKVIAELELRTRDIAELTQTVGRISDQTNLLALNAAIEAARAGEHGRGFAVVADEVRALAETSDRNALEVRELTAAMGDDVERVVAALRAAADSAAREAKVAAEVIDALRARRDEISLIAESSRQILSSIAEAERASAEVDSGANQIASAAEEQSAGAGQAQSAVQQQTKSLDQSQLAAQALAELAERLRRGKGGEGSAEQIGSAAEELSATIQELSSSSTQIMAAVEQIDRAARMQAAATHQASAALLQIDKTAKLAESNVRAADERIRSIDAALKSGRTAIDGLAEGVRAGLAGTQSSIATIGKLGGLGRKIEKIVDGIALIAVQTGMLAVSGSVEAARAGDSGRGFAIVSNDIRRLAREASANVDRAKDTVRGVLEQIAVLKNELEQIGAAAESEVDNSRRVATALEKLSGEVGEMRAANHAIVGRAAEILAATGEASTGARQVAAASEQASAAARKASTAAAEQASAAEDLAAATEEIASLGEELKNANA